MFASATRKRRHARQSLGAVAREAFRHFEKIIDLVTIAPALVPALGLTSGVVLLGGNSPSWLSVSATLSLASVLLLASFSASRQTSASTGILLCAFVALGVGMAHQASLEQVLTPLHHRWQDEAHLRPDLPWKLTGRVASPIEHGLEDRRFDFEVHRALFSGRQSPDEGRLRVTVRGRQLRELDTLMVGHRLSIWARLREARPYRNFVTDDHPPSQALSNSRRTQLFASVKSAWLVNRLEAATPSPTMRASGWIRGFLAKRLRSAPLSPEARAVAFALVLGERRQLQREVADSFRDGGTLHVLAVSGAHVAFWIWILVRVSVFLFPDYRPRWVVVLIFVLVYPVVCGGRPPVVRACLMAAVIVSSRSLSLDSPTINSLAISALILIAWRPLDIFLPGFQLSFLATVSILTFFKRIRNRLWFLGPMAAPLALSLSALIGILPVLATHFQEWVPGSVLSTMVATPAAMLAMTLATGLCLLPAILQGPVAYLFEICVGFLLSVNEISARSALGVVPLDQPGWLWLGAYLLTAAGLVLGKRKFVFFLIWVSLVLSISVGERSRGRLELHMLDVGHGDALALKLPDGQWMLIDSGVSLPGFDAGARIVSPALARLGVRRLSAMVLTHADRDHMGGMASVMRRFPVEEFWLGNSDASSLAPELSERLQESGARAVVLEAGQSFRLGGARFTVVAVDAALGGEGPSGAAPKRNDRSVVLRVDWAGRRLLLAGDIEQAMESRLSSHPRLVGADILKVAHHGSASSSQPEFLDVVRPSIALVSARADGTRPLPSPQVIARLHGRGIETLRTDRDGAISVTIDAAGHMRVITARQRLRSQLSH